jgi:ATPase
VVGEIYQLALTVKIPEGMISDDLARPVIVVTSFFTKKVEYEIYTFGEQIVVMPITEDGTGATSKKSMVSEYAKQGINQRLQKLLPCDFLLKVKGSGVDLYIPDYAK